jgi:hypothetical protein
LSECDILLSELHEKEPNVAAWLESNLNNTHWQWQCSALGALGFMTYRMYKSNVPECLFAKLCVQQIQDVSLLQMTPWPMIYAMTGLMEKQATQFRGLTA